MTENNNVLSLDEIEDWVKEVLGQPAVQLIELRSRMTDKRVRTWVLAANGDGGRRADARVMAEQLQKAATRDGRTQNAPEVTYLALALRTEGDSQWENSLSLEVPGKGARKVGDFGEPDPATAGGQLAQLMRFGENLHRMLLSSRDGVQEDVRWIVGELKADNIALRTELKENRKERVDMLVLAEDLASDKMGRELQQQRMKLEEKKANMMEEKLGDLWPIALNRLSGGGPGKGAPFMGQGLLKQLLGSLKPGQLPRLLSSGILNESQMALVGELYTAYGEAAQAEEEARQKKHEEPSGHGTNGTSGAAAPEEKPS